MMKTKMKICCSCNTEQFIWKRHEGKPFCKNCWSTHLGKNIQKPTVKKVIPRVSKKRAKQDIEYLKLRLEFLNENSLCQVKFPGCSNFATDVHHSFAGSNRNEHYLDKTSYFATCRSCHNHIHSNPLEARELGYLK
jgi:hypothetical protein